MAWINSLSGEQTLCDKVVALPKYYEFGIISEKEKRNEKIRKMIDEKLSRRPSRKKPYERNYHEEKKKELSPKRKVPRLDAANAKAVDVNAAYAEPVYGTDAYAEAVDANAAAYADPGYTGKELVLYEEKETPEAERWSNEEVVSEHEKMEFLPVNIPKKKRSVTPPVEKDYHLHDEKEYHLHDEKDYHLHEPMDDDASEATYIEYEEPVEKDDYLHEPMDDDASEATYSEYEELVEKDDYLHQPMYDDDISEVTDSEYEEDEEEEEEKPRKKKAQGNRTMRNKSKSTEPAPPQDMSEVMQQTVIEIIGAAVIEIIGAAPVNWIDEKSLTMSDIKRQQGRLFLPQHVRKFLTPSEVIKNWIFRGRGDNKSNSRNTEKKKEYLITLVEPDGTASEIDFKIWSSLGKGEPGEGQPVLTGSNWNKFVRKYNVVEGTKLQFWCFRKPGSNEFCFAINNKV